MFKKYGKLILFVIYNLILLILFFLSNILAIISVVAWFIEFVILLALLFNYGFDLWEEIKNEKIN